MAVIDAFKGILPAMQVPFNDDFSIDEPELSRFSKWLASHEGIGGLVTNGHTGEVFAYQPKNVPKSPESSPMKWRGDFR